jgi:hypothetical protein
MKKKKLKQLEIDLKEKHHQIWNSGFDAGIQIGMYEAIGILMFQAEKHGNTAGINDLIKLIKDDIENVAGSYGI